MGHELVFGADGKALMMYRKNSGAGLPWHGFGHGYEDAPELDEVIKVCGFDRTIDLHDVQMADGFVLPDVRAVKDSVGRYLGTVGPDYKVLQDLHMAESLKPWLDGGYAEIETAGMLSGGSRVWAQLRIKEGNFEVSPGDEVRTLLMVAQGHDMTLGLVSGFVHQRVVCANTISIALREDGLVRRKHRGNMKEAAADIQTRLFSMKAANEKAAEAFRFLASREVEEKDVTAFITALTGKETSRAGGPGERIRQNFTSGIGSRASTYWDLLNAVTQDTSHGLGNKMKDDRPGDAEGRALNKLFFGASSKLNETAMKVALNLASGRDADAKLDTRKLLAA